MAETMPAHTEAEQTSFKNASTTIKDGIHKAPTSIETQAIPEPTNGTTTAPDEAFEVTSVPHENGAVQVTTSDAVNGSTQTTEEEAVPAPVQTTTGEPNGTNGISNADNTKEAEQDNDETPLFSPSLISPEVAALLPEGYSIRPLQRSDYHKGFLDTLRVLTTVGSPTFETFSQHFTVMKSMPSTYHTLVVLDHNATIVGTGAVIVERKFIHNMGLVGHIEDIAVAKNQQGKKLGLRIIQALDYVAEKVGCYKCILDCSEANEGFYVKCGFKRAGLEMAHYYGRD